MYVWRIKSFLGYRFCEGRPSHIQSVILYCSGTSFTYVRECLSCVILCLVPREWHDSLKRSFTVMRRTFKRGTKARLSFSGGSHVLVNMADSMENAGSWTVSGSKEAMEVPKKFKDLRKLGVRNIAQQTWNFLRFFQPTFTSSKLSPMFAGACGPPEKLGCCACTFCACLWNTHISRSCAGAHPWDKNVTIRRYSSRAFVRVVTPLGFVWQIRIIEVFGFWLNLPLAMEG